MAAVAEAAGLEGRRRDADREVRAALALSEAPGLGPARFRRLVDHYGSAVDTLRAAAAGSLPLPGLSGGARRALRSLRPVAPARLVELREKRIRIVTYGAPGYPLRLLDLYHPPPVLYLRGPLRPGATPAVAIVGTRRATEYGRRVARSLGAELAAAGWTIVSGLARGIDAEAHRGALERDGSTVGVLGHGLDHVFPASSRCLFEEVADRGLLASEFAPEVRPAPGHFPRRNRIIAALSDAVVVVQAGRRSGALHTVDHALELGREVFAVPGPVDLPASEGTHALLREGARLTTCAEDVLRDLGGVSRPDRDLSPPRAADADERAILSSLAEGQRDADELALAAGLEIGRALAVLSRLEIRGHVLSLPGGRFVVARSAG